MSTPRRWALLIGGSAAALALGCAADGVDPASVRLVDEFSRAQIEGSPGEVPVPERTEWTFAEGDAGWVAGTGVADLEARDGALAGRSTSAVPVVHVACESCAEDSDVLEEVVVRARISAGTQLAVNFARQETLDVEEAIARIDDFPWQLSSPRVEGDEVQTYTMRTSSTARTSYPASGIRHLLLRPTDVADAEFEIESVRLVFRGEHLASIPSGVSWQGLGEVYRETLVARAPERLLFDLELGDRPLLDLAVGTLEEGPVTFRVGAVGVDRPLLEQTVSTPNRWHEVTLELDRLGSRADLFFELEADEPGALGFWGAPAIRRQGTRPGGPDAPRNVIFVLMDTLRSDHLEAYGYERETAPAIAQMAREGTRFSDAIAQGAWTKVSVPSMMSSTYPSSNGVWELFHRLPASADTLAEVFRGAGYATWGASANGFSGRANNLHQGFEVLHERSSIDLPEGHPRSKTARALNDRFLPWLETHRDVPFFAFFHPIDPHSPYQPYRPYDTMWGREDGEAAYEAWRDKVRELVEERRRNGRLPHAEDLEEVGLDPDEFNRLTLDWYDGSIRGADVEMKRLFEKLDELGLSDDTLVVFVSDHGEEFFEHGGGFHEDNVYGELVNVPLILRWPGGIPAGLTVPETVEVLDLAPTLLQLMRLEVPESMQGESLLPLLGLGEGRWSSRPAISEWMRRTDQLARGGVDSVSFIQDGYKLVHNFGRPGAELPEGMPEYELYAHADDPLDLHDIAASKPEVVVRLAEQLAGWRDWVTARKLPDDADAAAGLDAEELERLKSLGYL